MLDALLLPGRLACFESAALCHMRSGSSSSVTWYSATAARCPASKAPPLANQAPLRPAVFGSGATTANLSAMGRVS